MEESKAAAYYDELTRKGEGAARFKQGLGFSTSESNNNFVSSAKGSALPSSSSFLSSFVRASSPSKTTDFQKQAQLDNIQNKLKKKKPSLTEEEERRSRVSERGRRESSPKRKSLGRDRESDPYTRSRRRSRSRERERHSRRRSGSREKYRDRDKGKDSDRQRRRRSRSRSDSDGDRRRRRLENIGSDGGKKGIDSKAEEKKKNGGVDYLRLIKGYDMMSPAERVKAKMKLQLAETAEEDVRKGISSGWERFEFDKNAPLDDEEIEAAEDDKTLVKHIGQSFRFSTVEARREEQIKAAHDEAMFGAPTLKTSSTIASEEDEVENDEKESNENGLAKSLLSEKVLAKQQGSWRDRARKV